MTDLPLRVAKIMYKIHHQEVMISGIKVPDFKFQNRLLAVAI